MYTPRLALPTLAASLLLAAPAAPAEDRLVGVPVIVPIPWTAAPYGLHCYPYGTCLDRGQRLLLERRREREAALRAGLDADGTSAAGDASKPRAGTLPMPTGALSEANLQPAYRTIGAVRPEFAQSGEYLPPYRDRDAATAAEPSPASPQPGRRARPMMPCPQGRPEC